MSAAKWIFNDEIAGRGLHGTAYYQDQIARRDRVILAVEAALVEIADLSTRVPVIGLRTDYDDIAQIARDTLGLIARGGEDQS